MAPGIAQELGQIYLHSERRRRISAPLAGYYRDPVAFAALMRKSLLVRAVDHDFLLYEIDYDKKRSLAHHPTGPRHFSYHFGDRSLAMKVFIDRRETWVSDAQTELALPEMDRPNWLNLEGVATYQISGPVFACPVRAGGQTEAVLVTWSKLKANELNKGPNTGTLKLFHASCRQIRRLANLLANDIYGSELPLAASFLDGLYKLIREIDNGDTWTADRLQERVFCQRILEALMKAVLLPAAGLQRVRIWQSIFPCSSGPAKSHLPSEFVCIDSLTNKEATTAGKKLRCMYEGIRTPASDRYCRYTIARFLHDPHAKWQHPAMFGEIDPNCGKLDKDPKGSWIVAPIVSSRALKGFISADSHEPSHTGPTERTETDPRVVMLQCYILDIISDLARYVMPVQVPIPGEPAAVKVNELSLND